MGILDERERHDLHTWAVEAMGEKRADIFMRSLPPRGWDDLVTKDDLQRATTDLRAELLTAMHRESNKLLIALIASMLAATLGQEMIVRWFPPPPPQIILQPAAS